MRLLVPFVALPAALATGGCLTMTTHVKVKPDGSGTIVQTMTMNPQAFAGLGPGEKGKGPGALTKAKAEQAAREIGEGVSVVSFEPIDTKQAAGGKLTLAFKDVTKIKVDQKPDAGGPPAAKSDDEALRFKLTKLPNGNALLTVGGPRPAKADAKGSASAASPPEVPAEELAMMRQMFKGARVAVTVEVDGTLVKTNSAYAQGPVVTILDVDFDALMADEANLKKFGAVIEGSPEEAKRLLKGVKGAKVNVDPEIRIEFAGK
jgi:hypothetical protein